MKSENVDLIKAFDHIHHVLSFKRLEKSFSLLLYPFDIEKNHNSGLDIHKGWKKCVCVFFNRLLSPTTHSLLLYLIKLVKWIVLLLSKKISSDIVLKRGWYWKCKFSMKPH